MNRNDRITLQPIERVPLTELVARRIMAMIIDDQMQIGDRLPSQKDLVEMLNVSRPSLREALSGLVMVGFLEAKAGQGFYIRKIPASKEMDFSQSLPHIGDNTVLELFEARGIIEGELAALAAKRATEDDIEQMFSAVADLEKKIPESGALDASIDFHLLVAKAAHNSVLDNIARMLMEKLDEHIPNVFSDPPSFEREVELHLNIVKAIANHSPEDARKAALEHAQFYASDIELGNLWE